MGELRGKSSPPDVTVTKWPRQAWCCLAPGCGFLQPLGSAMPQMCPAHGTTLALVLLEPAAFDAPTISTAAPTGEEGRDAA